MNNPTPIASDLEDSLLARGLPESTAQSTVQHLDFPHNRYLPSLYGDAESHLRQIETALTVRISSRGNRLTIQGSQQQQQLARVIIESLYDRLEQGKIVTSNEVNAAIRMTPELATDSKLIGNESIEKASNGTLSQTMASQNRDSRTSDSLPSDPKPKEIGELKSIKSSQNKSKKPASSRAIIQTKRMTVEPYNQNQSDYIEALHDCELVFGIGPAGTGKTYLAVAAAVEMLLNGQVSRLILSRPAVEAGEKLGFLPGDMREKVDPYLRPLFDALYDMMPAELVARKLLAGEIEIAPLAFMRGRTLANSFIILDEAQNTTPSQMKMFLTRLGDQSRMVVTGDPSQVDLPISVTSGLQDALEMISYFDRSKGGETPSKPDSLQSRNSSLRVIEFLETDVVRHPLVMKIVKAYNLRELSKSNRGKAAATVSPTVQPLTKS